MGCLGGVLGGYFGLGDFVSWAYVWVFEVGELLVPTWDNFREWGSAGWIFLPPFPTVSHSAPASSELTVEDVGVVGFFFTRWCGRDYRSLLFDVCYNWWEGIRILVGLFRGLFFPGQTAERWPISPQCQQVGLRLETITGSLRPSTSNQLGTE